MRFAQPQFLWILLAAIPAIAALFYWSWRVKQKLIRQFVQARLLASLTMGVSTRRQTFRIALVVAAVAGTLLALARPQWGFAWEEAKQQGLDIIVAIDTSRSMLAQDVEPNRLEKAKLAAFDLMRQARYDRLGLVAFAGTAFLQSPLTLDDQAYLQNVEALKVGIIPQGGTALSAAIRTSLAAFEKNNDNHKVLVLFTDGEDHDADTETLAAAKEAAQAGMHIFTVGVGTPEGELLRVMDEQGNFSFVKDDDGNVVKSRLNQTLLQQIATEANGFYLPLQGANPMETLYARGLAPLPKGESTTRQMKVPLERYHWFLGFAVVCLLLEFLLPESPRSRRTDTAAAASRTALQQTVAALCFLLVALSGQASPSAAFKDYETGNFKSAFDEYNRLSEQNTNDYRLHYDAGAAAYRAKQLEKAEQQFNATLASPEVTPDLTTQERTYYNLGNTKYQMGQPLSDPDKKQELWQQAIDCYTNALRLNTNQVDVDAKKQSRIRQTKTRGAQTTTAATATEQNQNDQKDQERTIKESATGPAESTKSGSEGSERPTAAAAKIRQAGPEEWPKTETRTRQTKRGRAEAAARAGEKGQGKRETRAGSQSQIRPEKKDKQKSPEEAQQAARSTCRAK